MSETTVGFETLRGDVWGAAVVAAADYGRVVGFGGESCNACPFGVGNGLGAALTQVEDLLWSLLREKICFGVNHTRRQARTGPSITLRGILMAEIT